MILHMTLNFLHYYLVQSNGVTYRYVTSAGKRGTAEPESIANEIPEQPADIRKNTSMVESTPKEIPAFIVEEKKAQPIETPPAPKIAEQKNNAERNEQNEITGYMIDAEKSDLPKSQPAPLKRQLIHTEEENPEQETPPVQKEMLRYVFGPYKNNNSDDEKDGK